VCACGRIGFDPVPIAGNGDCDRGNQTYASGVTFPAGDGCNSCVCISGVIQCTTNVCIDACATCADSAIVDPCASMAGCPSVECGGEEICCGVGEYCIGGTSADATCSCGGGAPCVIPQTCQVALMAGSVCGSVCQ